MFSLKTSPPVGLPSAYQYFIETIDKPKTWLNPQRWYWRIKHRNGNVIAGAEYYSSPEQRSDTINYFSARHNFPIWDATARQWTYMPPSAFDPYSAATGK